MEDKVQIDIVQTKDAKEYKIERDLFVKYSRFYRTMIQDSDEEVFQLYNIHSSQFDYLYEFMQLHKKNQPLPLKPVQPAVSLKTVMEEVDAELVSRIFENPPEKVKAVVDAAFFLHMDDLLKRLAAGMISHLDKGQTKRLVNESRKSEKVSETQVSEEIHNKIKMIFETRRKEA